MAKSSWEKTFEKNVNKQAREAKQQARIEARQNQAASIVNGQPMIGNIRLLDKTSEELVAILAEGYNREDYIVTNEEVTIPIYLKNSLALEFEKLKQYGMISNYCCNVTGDWNVNILPCLLTYFEDKECASVQSSSNTNNFYGDVAGIQIQQGTVNSTQNQTTNQGLDSEFGDKAPELREKVNEVSNLAETKSNPSRIKILLGDIKNLAIGVSGSLIASGIINYLQGVL